MNGNGSKGRTGREITQNQQNGGSSGNSSTLFFYEPTRREVLLYLPNEDCSQNCSTLYFYDADGAELDIVQGTRENIALNNVAKVKTLGEYGCYTIYKEAKFASYSFCWKGKEERNVGRKDDGYEFAVVRSFQASSKIFSGR